MKIKEIHSHLHGYEWIQYHQKGIWKELEAAITQIGIESSPSDLNKKLKHSLKKLGWQESIQAMNFVKNRVAVEVQIKQDGFNIYDLFASHLAFYLGDTIDVGIEILPMKSLQAQMSSGPGYYEGALYDLARQGRGVPAVPLVLIGIEP